jgi:hypothetical protein
MSTPNISRRIQPGLWTVERPRTGVKVWMAMANGITYISYDEANTRLWLSREMDDPEPPAAA